MKLLALCAACFAAPSVLDGVVEIASPPAVAVAAPFDPEDGHACLLMPALSLDACDGSRDCFVDGAEACALPPGWNGPTHDRCVCP